MKADITILETNFEVEYDFDITAHGCSSTGWDEPGWGAERDIEVLGIADPKQPSDVTLELPKWLKDLIETHLCERDDINTVVQQADQDGASDDYDDEL